IPSRAKWSDIARPFGTPNSKPKRSPLPGNYLDSSAPQTARAKLPVLYRETPNLPYVNRINRASTKEPLIGRKRRIIWKNTPLASTQFSFPPRSYNYSEPFSRPARTSTSMTAIDQQPRQTVSYPNSNSSPTDLASLVQRHQTGVWRYVRFLGADTAEADD